MAAGLTEAALQPVIDTRPELVEQALRVTYDDPQVIQDLATLRATAEIFGTPLAELLIRYLEKDALTGKFAAFLLQHGIDLPDGALPAQPDWALAMGEFGAVTGPGFDEEALALFVRRSRAFRCRIKVNNVVAGSGVLISPRLVLTAAHVLTGAQGQPIRVQAADGQSYAARRAFSLPPHPDEERGLLPPAGAALTHPDVALLRLDRPLGHLFGRVDLSNLAQIPPGTHRFVLVHFPAGQEAGIEFGRLLRATAQDIRLKHDALSAEGSSGGAGFDRELRFVGLHQGRWDNSRRLVPHDQFVANDDFAARLRNDSQPRYPWSHDGSIDGHILIGRAAYFDGIAALVAGEAEMLRGLWIRRLDTAQSAGISFSYPVLQFYLRQMAAPDETHRIAPEEGSGDLVALVAETVLGAGALPKARAGVAPGETTDIAVLQDAARQLAASLQARAESSSRPIWLYVETAEGDLPRDQQLQLEHLIAACAPRPLIRIVLAGFESVALTSQLVTSLGEAQSARRPCLMREVLGPFTRAEVVFTLTEMARDLALGWDRTTVEDHAEAVLAGIAAQAGTYDGSQIGEVAARIRTLARQARGEWT
ncbi:trypsin-like peptidase domain-containing protein [Pseudooceanicola nanhaiensis]|uniref:trypsin-like peptidase domain-containing protein n=1 Tax=Pseudooceanicola nanhaiensis TaxID=375761 RepID=UPI001CD307E2|nr:serine protease [Pseudooceanicola nanhaiensis]MCA0919035.1 serine protease [Pseudooceanicola nanhaiensis]